MKELDLLSAKIDRARAELEDHLGESYPLMAAAELKTLPSQPWLVDQVVPMRGQGILLGPSGSGKSFLDLDLSAAVAEGKPWFGHNVEQGPVVLLNLEGGGGIPSRVAAWEHDRGRPFPEDVWFGFDQFNVVKPNEVEALCDAIEAKGGTRLLVIDTLNRASAGVDENGPSDMGRIIAGANRLQERLNCIVIFVHHPGKDASRGPRGHSSLLAAADFVILVERRGGLWTWRLYKAKDAADGVVHGFELKVVELPALDGAKVGSSCVISPLDLGGLTTPALLPKGRNQRTVLEELSAIIESTDVGSVDFEAAVDQIKGSLQVDKDRQHERTVDALKSLVRQGFVQRDGQFLRLSAVSDAMTVSDADAHEAFDEED